ncbi:MAG: hypothetical protein ACK4FK_14100 [Ferrovibrio sp.]|uniref:hypothetical protein n=1 Tax=Ferrovibrio sp. TaxID=1917215 RepID=UPI00391BC714
MKGRNPLVVGFYTVPEAARLIRVGSARRIYGWLKGYPGRNVGPLLTRDFEPVDGYEELSFLDLMEVRFVEHFREYGVKVGSLRRAAEELKAEFKTDHPFALSKVLLAADKADVFVVETLRKAAKAEGDPRLRSLTTRNYVMYEAIKQSLVPGIEFDATSHLAKQWRPMPDRFPEIVVDPLRAFGRPIIAKGIPTETLRDAWRVEGRKADPVAEAFGITAKEVLEAVNFEQALDEPIPNVVAA